MVEINPSRRYSKIESLKQIIFLDDPLICPTCSKPLECTQVEMTKRIEPYYTLSQNKAIPIIAGTDIHLTFQCPSCFSKFEGRAEELEVANEGEEILIHNALLELDDSSKEYPLEEMNPSKRI